MERPLNTYSVDSMLDGEDRLHIRTMFNAREVSKSIIDMKEECVRETLKNIGWAEPYEATKLRNQVAVLREALATIKYHAKDTPSDFDISVIQNTADIALEQTEDKLYEEI